MECFFCDIAAGKMGRPIYQDDDVTAFRDIAPQAPTHILIIPNRHITSLSKSGDDDRDVLGKLLERARKLAVEEGLDSSGYRVVINDGEQGGQSVFHIHAHLLGGRQMQWPPG